MPSRVVIYPGAGGAVKYQIARRRRSVTADRYRLLLPQFEPIHANTYHRIRCIALNDCSTASTHDHLPHNAQRLGLAIDLR